MPDGTCIACGSPLKERRRKYCSLACLGDDRRKAVEVTCPCGVVFAVSPARFAAGRGKYCSRACSYANRTRPTGLIYNVVNDNPTKFKPGLAPWNKGTSGLQVPWNKDLQGIHLSPATEFKPGHAAGAKNWRWNGGPGARNIDQPGYRSIHWRRLHAYGKAADYSCAFADETCKGRMEWACVSQEYKDVEDFMPLCRSHHVRYDGGAS